MQPQYITPTSPKFSDLTGQRFGRLVALGVVGKDTSGSWIWHCRCDCGNEKNIRAFSLQRGATQSCGCLNRERASARAKIHRPTHRMSLTPIYQTWVQMVRRCHNPKHPRYKDYGGRGISVCREWRESFEAFYAHVGDHPAGLSLDRINNDGNYEPGNVRWVTARVQAQNRRKRRA